MSKLAKALSELLMHEFREAVVVKAEDDTGGVALMLDGWYSADADELGMGAAAAVDFWQHLLDQVFAELERERTRA